MNTAHFQEGMMPALDASVRFDSPWGKRAGGDVTLTDTSDFFSLNRLHQGVHSALPIRPGELVDDETQGFSVYIAARAALSRIPGIHGLTGNAASAWSDAGILLGRVYPRYFDQHRHMLRFTPKEATPTSETIAPVSKLVLSAISQEETGSDIKAGGNMLLTWLALSKLVSLPPEQFSALKTTFMKPSVSEVA